jgi:hypothetical protein
MHKLTAHLLNTSACLLPVRSWQPTSEWARARTPETGAYLGYSAYSCKSLQPKKSRKTCEILPTCQRAFLNLECPSSIPPRSATHSCFQRIFFSRQMRAFLIHESLKRINYRTFASRIPKVSSHSLRNSRFLETRCGDRRRKQLRGRWGSELSLNVRTART